MLIRRRWAAVAALVAFIATSQTAMPAEAPMRAFPSHTKYFSGSIKPNHVSQTQMDGRVRAFYSAWKTAFLRQGCGRGRYYTWLGPQSPIEGGTPISVSEMHGLGMIIVAYMAGADPNARTIFDGLHRFFRDHPSQHSPDLMAWRQLDTCASSHDPNSASDGDLAIAYALLLAHQQWGSAGAVNYRREALAVLSAVQRHATHPRTKLTQMGDWVHPDYPLEHEAIRTSDFMPQMLRAFAKTTGLRAWRDTLGGGYGMLEKMQTTHAARTGLLPDFITNTTSLPIPAPSGFNGEWRSAAFAFNACRVPWLVTLDFLMHGEPRSKRIVQRINGWVVGATGGDPYRLFAGYELNGSPIVGYSHVCFAGTMGVAAMIDAKHQAWLNRMWDDVAITFVDTPNDPYGAALRMLYMLTMSGNWWAP